MAAMPNAAADPLGKKCAQEPAKRAGAGNPAEVLLGRARVEPLAHDQPEPGPEKGAEGGDVQVDDDGAERACLVREEPLEKQATRRLRRRRLAPASRARSCERFSSSRPAARSRQQPCRDDHGRERREAQRGEEQRVARGLAADKLRRDSASTEHGCHDRAGVRARKRHRTCSKRFIQGWKLQRSYHRPHASASPRLARGCVDTSAGLHGRAGSWWTLMSLQLDDHAANHMRCDSIPRTSAMGRGSPM